MGIQNPHSSHSVDDDQQSALLDDGGSLRPDCCLVRLQFVGVRLSENLDRMVFDQVIVFCAGLVSVSFRVLVLCVCCVQTKAKRGQRHGMVVNHGVGFHGGILPGLQFPHALL